MLVVTVELWPYGLEEAKEVLAKATIANCGRDGEGHCYRAELHERGDPSLNIAEMNKTVEIPAHDRRQSVWRLLERVLRAAHVYGRPEPRGGSLAEERESDIQPSPENASADARKDPLSQSEIIYYARVMGLARYPLERILADVEALSVEMLDLWHWRERKAGREGIPGLPFWGEDGIPRDKDGNVLLGWGGKPSR
ncbi:hypothetical protein E2493_15005 [Sphingomonas parva]|uniref:Uncharacterized protein n=1 Tax=Sphingomonas parva TaxID=2555898 RepID=A0A4Y8ZNC2_9SPHN|nr:hypothetical protein [Sphingomonas parva]TFI57510.1 hypothetical protein E2493_15005 [Sphingomonas parva]